MTDNPSLQVNRTPILWLMINWFFAVLFMAIGLINLFWGNDPFYGVFIILLAMAFVPPVTAFVKRKTGLALPWYFKVLLALFILWTALGVAELFDKIGLMLQDLG